jgi:dTDP-glucose pyrophosphorylase
VWEEANPIADLSTVTIPSPGRWLRGDHWLTLAQQPPPRDPRADAQSAWLDAGLSLPFFWRVPVAGERWRPLGSSGSQTVTKTLGEHGIPSRRRPVTAVLADGNGVLWMPGIAGAERARVVVTATSGWRLTLEEVPRADSVPPMQNPTVTVVILAAGKGTRMGSDLAKVLHPLAGRPLIGHVLKTCAALGVGQTVVVVGHQREAVEALVKPLGAETALQDKQLGTGHAVLVAKSVVRGDTVIVLCGDCPMTPPSLLFEVLAKHRASGAACTAVAARLADPGKYGRMITDPATGRVTRIVEWKDASDAERAIKLINSGIYAFAAADLWRCLENVKPNNAQGEYYLTDVVGLLVAEGRAVELVSTDDLASVRGINTPDELAEAEQLYAKRTRA